MPPELRGEVCWDVWLRSDDSAFRRVPKPSWAARQGHSSQALPTWLSWLWELTDGCDDMLDHSLLLLFFFIILNQASAP